MCANGEVVSSRDREEEQEVEPDADSERKIFCSVPLPVVSSPVLMGISFRRDAKRKRPTLDARDGLFIPSVPSLV